MINFFPTWKAHIFKRSTSTILNWKETHTHTIRNINNQRMKKNHYPNMNNQQSLVKFKILDNFSLHNFPPSLFFLLVLFPVFLISAHELKITWIFSPLNLSLNPIAKQNSSQSHQVRFRVLLIVVDGEYYNIKFSETVIRWVASSGLKFKWEYDEWKAKKCKTFYVPMDLNDTLKRFKISSDVNVKYTECIHQKRTKSHERWLCII